MRGTSQQNQKKPRVLPHGFTLIELIIVLVLVTILSTLSFSGWKAYNQAATRAHCCNNLRQLCTATMLYLGDHDNYFPPYLQQNADGSRTWYFGNETTPAGTAEGDRDLDRTAGPLYPYIQTVGSIEVCKGFNYGSALWKPKFKGASYGYGYNWWLGGRSGGAPMNVSQLSGGSRVVLFGDCAQANTFQAPASPTKPMLEEFYIIDERNKTVHFRHNGHANILFVDGHVESFTPYAGTLDTRMKGEILGQIAKAGNKDMFR